MKASNVAAAIRRLRKERGLTQEQLGARAGTSSVAMIESGRRVRPQYETLEKIAAALGVPVAELVAKRRPRRASGS